MPCIAAVDIFGCVRPDGHDLDAALVELTERLAAQRMVGAFSHDEEHRDVERPLGVLPVAEVRLENERQQATAIGIGIAPDVDPAGREPTLGAALER